MDDINLEKHGISKGAWDLFKSVSIDIPEGMENFSGYMITWITSLPKQIQELFVPGLVKVRADIAKSAPDVEIQASEEAKIFNELIKYNPRLADLRYLNSGDIFWMAPNTKYLSRCDGVYFDIDRNCYFIVYTPIDESEPQHQYFFNESNFFNRPQGIGNSFASNPDYPVILLY